MITLTYRLTKEQFLRASRSAGSQVQRRRSKTVFALLMLGLAAVVIGLMLFASVVLEIDLDGVHLGAFYAGIVVLALIVVLNRVLLAKDSAAMSMEDDAARGDMTAQLSAEGARFENAISTSFVAWAGISEVMEVSGGTALRIGAVIHPIPDTALAMVDMDGSQFRAKLRAWKDAA